MSGAQSSWLLAASRLPDEVWIQAFLSVQNYPTNSIVGPDEMQEALPQLQTFKTIENLHEYEIAIIHKGRDTDMQHAQQLSPKEWHVLFANPVFVVLGLRKFEPAKFPEIDVPPSLGDFLPQRPEEDDAEEGVGTKSHTKAEASIG